MTNSLISYLTSINNNKVKTKQITFIIPENDPLLLPSNHIHSLED